MNYAEFRKQHGLTQIEFARAVGVSLNTYILWEKGANYPNPENQEKIDEFVKKVEKGEK